MTQMVMPFLHISSCILLMISSASGLLLDELKLAHSGDLDEDDIIDPETNRCKQYTFSGICSLAHWHWMLWTADRQIHVVHHRSRSQFTVGSKRSSQLESDIEIGVSGKPEGDIEDISSESAPKRKRRCQELGPNASGMVLFAIILTGHQASDPVTQVVVVQREITPWNFILVGSRDFLLACKSV